MTENPLIDQLKELEQEHRDLDEVLIQLQEKQTVDFQQIQRLKKRKLILKDKIIFLGHSFHCDCILWNENIIHVVTLLCENN